MLHLNAALRTCGLAMVCLATLFATNLHASILFGGLGGHNSGDSTNDGSLTLVNQATGAVTVIGQPSGVSRISGLAFDLFGNLFAATQPAGGFPPPPGPTGASSLLGLNPGNGAIISSVLISDGTNGISIADLAVQPVTGVLYGIRSPLDQLNGQGKLYTINKATGLATLVGDTGDYFASIAFSPAGTLYMASADLNAGTMINTSLKTLNPANAAILSTVNAPEFYGALAVRPEDGVIFAGNGDVHQLFTLNPNTGAETLIGDTGLNFVGGLAFQIPEPASFALAGLGLIALIVARRQMG